MRYLMGGGTLAEETIFKSRKGRFTLHSRRMADYPKLVSYALARVPPASIRNPPK